MIYPKYIKQLVNHKNELTDIINDFHVIKEKTDYKEALQYVMDKYHCDAKKAGEIVRFTREHDSLCWYMTVVFYKNKVACNTFLNVLRIQHSKIKDAFYIWTYDGQIVGCMDLEQFDKVVCLLD